MCGIAGFVKLHEPAEAAAVKAMCDRIRYRGPDDEGYYTDGGCGMGMRRLSIIDLTTGHQPISNEDGSIWVVFNGEIYNYQELRRRLIGQGHKFRTGSDTETLVHLYEEEGEEGVAHLRGMFSYAIWDTRRQRLYLARDRFGKKPLYYAVRPEGLYFGSELKCLLTAGVPAEIDDDALRLYFQLIYIPDPHTCYRAARKLEPGCWLTYDRGGEIRQGRYWRLPPPTSGTTASFTEEEACRRIRELFDESVRLRMIADVPLGAFLSGGIDSSLIVAAMALQSPDPVQTFSVGFAEAAVSELPYAAQVARHYKTLHREITVRPDSTALVGRLVEHFDEPFADAAAIPTLIMSEFARTHVKVALSGDGGDELFAGYASFQKVEKLRVWDRVPRPLRRLGSRIADWLPYSAYGKNYLHAITRLGALERYFDTGCPYFMARQLLAPEWLPPADTAFLQRALPDCFLPQGADPLSQATYFEATANLTGDMLAKVDRMSMAASLEVRCPLLDHELAEFAQRIPNSWKLHGGRGKRILLKALGDRLPPEVMNRPKMGFSVPIAEWFRGPLREMLHDTLLSKGLAERGIVSPEFVRTLLNEHDRGRRNNYYWLWALIMLELWFRHTESRPGAAAGPAPLAGTIHAWTQIQPRAQ
jgi:asparagine synthase (glutamine-hydrolysing)